MLYKQNQQGVLSMGPSWESAAKLTMGLDGGVCFSSLITAASIDFVCSMQKHNRVLKTA